MLPQPDDEEEARRKRKAFDRLFARVCVEARREEGPSVACKSGSQEVAVSPRLQTVANFQKKKEIF